jgi:disulfide bond formation protein DsbB
MYYVEITLFVVGLVLLIVGYRKNRRNVLLVAAIVLFLSGALGSFVKGYKDGYSGSRNAHSSSIPGQQPNNSFKPTPLRGAA